jgi:WD40 repeat protein
MLTVFNATDGQVRWKAEIDWGLMSTPAVFSPDGRTLVQETDGILRFFDAQSGRERLGDDDPHQGKVSTIRFTPDGLQVVAAELAGSVRVWDPTTARPLGVIRPGGPIALMAISPDGRSLATAAWGSLDLLVVWDLKSRRRRRSWPTANQAKQVKALAFTPDGEAVLAYGNDGRLRAFELITGRERPAVQPRFNLPEPSSPYGPVIERGAFSPANRFLAVRAGKVVRVADLLTGEERFTGPCFAMAFSPDGKGLAITTPANPILKEYGSGKVPVSTLNSEDIRLVDLDSGESRRIEIPPDLVRALAFSPDGTMLAVAGGMRRSTVRLYRTGDGRAVEELSLPAAVSSDGGLTFSPDGHRLAAGLDDTTIPIWDLRHVH